MKLLSSSKIAFATAILAISTTVLAQLGQGPLVLIRAYENDPEKNFVQPPFDVVIHLSNDKVLLRDSNSKEWEYFDKDWQFMMDNWDMFHVSQYRWLNNPNPNNGIDPQDFVHGGFTSPLDDGGSFNLLGVNYTASATQPYRLDVPASTNPNYYKAATVGYTGNTGRQVQQLFLYGNNIPLPTPATMPGWQVILEQAISVEVTDGKGYGSDLIVVDTSTPVPVVTTPVALANTIINSPTPIGRLLGGGIAAVVPNGVQVPISGTINPSDPLSPNSLGSAIPNTPARCASYKSSKISLISPNTINYGTPYFQFVTPTQTTQPALEAQAVSCDYPAGDIRMIAWTTTKASNGTMAVVNYGNTTFATMASNKATEMQARWLLTDPEQNRSREIVLGLLAPNPNRLYTSFESGASIIVTPEGSNKYLYSLDRIKAGFDPAARTVSGVKTPFVIPAGVFPLESVRYAYPPGFLDAANQPPTAPP